MHVIKAVTANSLDVFLFHCLLAVTATDLTSRSSDSGVSRRSHTQIFWGKIWSGWWSNSLIDHHSNINPGSFSPLGCTLQRWVQTLTWLFLGRPLHIWGDLNERGLKLRTSPLMPKLQCLWQIQRSSLLKAHCKAKRVAKRLLKLCQDRYICSVYLYTGDL